MHQSLFLKKVATAMAKGLFEFAAPVKIYVKELAMDYCDLSRHY